MDVSGCGWDDGSFWGCGLVNAFAGVCSSSGLPVGQAKDELIFWPVVL